MQPDGRWALDTFLRSPAPGLTLLDRAQTHAPDAWHTAALVYDGRTMTHSVDGVRQGRGEVVFTPLGGGTHLAGHAPEPRVAFQGPDAPACGSGPRRVQTIPLWPEGVPGRLADGGDERWDDGRVSNIHDPSAGVPGPDRRRRPAPRSSSPPAASYARLAMANEAAGAAERLRAEGVATFVLKYRVAEYRFPAPLQDVLRAVRIVRSRAAEFGVEPDRIGILGASAGGHLAAMAGTLFDAPEGRTGHAARRGERPARLPRAALSRHPDGRTGGPSRLAPQPAGRDAGRQRWSGGRRSIGR